MIYTYYSCASKDIPLICRIQPPESGYIITVEDQGKWYNLFTIDETGYVAFLPYRLTEDYEHLTSQSAWLNHVPTPWFCKWLERQSGFVWDDRSLEIVLGRWVHHGHLRLMHDEGYKVLRNLFP